MNKAIKLDPILLLRKENSALEKRKIGQLLQKYTILHVLKMHIILYTHALMHCSACLKMNIIFYNTCFDTPFCVF